MKQQVLYKENYMPTHTLMSFTEWEEIHNEKEIRKRNEILYYIKQKLCGTFFTLSAFILPIIADGDATASLLFLPLGIFLMLTKEKIMSFK